MDALPPLLPSDLASIVEYLRNILLQLPPTERRYFLDYLRLPYSPATQPKSQAYTISDCKRAAVLVAELLALHPRWSRARARREVAGQLGISTSLLRRMLRRYEPGTGSAEP